MMTVRELAKMVDRMQREGAKVDMMRLAGSTYLMTPKNGVDGKEGYTMTKVEVEP